MVVIPPPCRSPDLNVLDYSVFILWAAVGKCIRQPEAELPACYKESRTGLLRTGLRKTALGWTTSPRLSLVLVETHDVGCVTMGCSEAQKSRSLSVTYFCMCSKAQLSFFHRVDRDRQFTKLNRDQVAKLVCDNQVAKLDRDHQVAKVDLDRQSASEDRAATTKSLNRTATTKSLGWTRTGCQHGSSMCCACDKG